MRYEYNKKMQNDREIVNETDHHIEYKINEEDQKLMIGAEDISCSIAGQDIIKKNVNLIYHKIILRLTEIYDENVSYFIDTYYKNLVKNEIRHTILKLNIPRSVLKNKTFYSLYNLENLNNRIYEQISSHPKLISLNIEFIQDLELYFQGLPRKIISSWRTD